MVTAEVVKSWNCPDAGDGDAVSYVVVDDHDVDLRILRSALVGRQFASWHLDIEPPPMGFFRAETPAERVYKRRWGADWLEFSAPSRGGQADRRTKTIAIGIDPPNDPARIVEVVAHEVIHLTQPRETSPQADELEAEAYGSWVSGLVVPDGSLVTVHVEKGRPYREHTLLGIAQWRDVLLCTLEDGRKMVYSNRASAGRVEWREDWLPCPVAPREAAAA